eukprot:TRINITY_DN13055_c0_g1_i1.p1 TRINITY_DN13055_c0_g1~~TRINITY_DN13055_c0_g1_i1.p1  ORF type:complete len:309 (+),score=91.96 TRINITY_DN13055_c0_g1_i1:38-928(+)
MATQSVEELQKQLDEYTEQLEIVDAALKEDPESADFLSVKENLLDVLKVTKELLSLQEASAQAEKQKEKFEDIQTVATAKGYFVGKEIEAKYKADGKYYKAKITSISEKGFGVTFDGYGNTDFLPVEEIREKSAKEIVMVDTTVPGAAAQAKSTDRFVVDEEGKVIIPQFMQILPTDTEQVRSSKKRKIKNYKSEYRLQKSTQTLKRKKQSWADFQSGGRKSKRARITKKKKSIFASPDTIEGRVGVVGSGAGMTKFERQKYTPKSLTGHTLPQTRIQGNNPWAQQDPDARFINRH